MAKTSKSAQTARQRRRSLRIQRVIYSLLVTLAAVIILYYLVVRPSGNISLLENGLGTIVSPIQNAFTSVTGFVKSWFGTSASTEDMERTIAELQEENQRLQIRINSYADMESENERLTVLLNAQDEYESLEPVYAKVVAKETGVWFETFTINRGFADGLDANMAVVNGDGLIGRIKEVGYNYAKVISIIDTRSSVAALIGRTRDNGMLQGEVAVSSTESECHMFYLPNIGNVKVGDEVFTSGLDSLFPKGIYIGTVTAVSRSSDSADKYVVVKPAVNFSSIEDVFVLKTRPITGNDILAPVPTQTPRPIATARPTSTVASIYAVSTRPPADNSQIWIEPTATPEPTPVPTATPKVDVNTIPEAMWLAE